MLKNIYCALDGFIHKCKFIMTLYADFICVTLVYHKENSLRSYNNDPYVMLEKVLNWFDRKIMRWTLNQKYH